MIRILVAAALMALMAGAGARGGDVRDPKQKLERTGFQTGGPYRPEVDIKSDVAMVYGIDAHVADRIKGWRDHGYIPHVMTGVAWGEYQDYFDGRWDGKNHEDESQTDRNGNVIGHGPTVPYVAPSETYGKYLCVGVKRAIDAGAEAIHLEEPEFWVRSGYSGSFKREWESYYHEPWIPPHTSPDAQYRASKLKYFLYRRALQQVFSFVADYSKQIGRKVRCFVPTHSMINYAHWGIVSPEQSLVMLRGCDGYIGQVWTGTARTPNLYNGALKERTFEAGFCEYGVLHNLVRTTGRRMYYLNDPVEDNPDHTWEDYRRNWECTLVASLLWPDVWHYEVAPWPERPFLGRYPTEDGGRETGADDARSPVSRPRSRPGERVGISPGYATELLTVFNALNDMNQDSVAWECGTQGLGILVSDTMMFQRGAPNPSDPHLSSFYGLALPLIKRGSPVQPVQMENLLRPNYLKPYKVLFLTYEGMKPPSPDLHRKLASWVQGGGVLAFVDDDSDPYNAVKEWWNSGDMHYAAPRIHLFEQLGLKADAAEGAHRIGKGALIYRRLSPASLAHRSDGAEVVSALAREACAEAKTPWKDANALILRRGPYIVAAGLDESPVAGEATVTSQSPQRASGLVDLFDPALAVRSEAIVKPGARLFLADLSLLRLSQQGRPFVVASASKITGERVSGNMLQFESAGPAATTAATRISLPSEPKSVTAGEYRSDQLKVIWDAGSHTVLLQYPNAPGGVNVRVQY